MPPRLMLTPEEIRTTIRRPLSLPMLVYYGQEWQVCYKAEGKMPGGRIAMAWVYGRESIFFCEVGQEKYPFDLPNPNEKPFFDNAFNHSVDEINEDGSRIRKLGGAQNVMAANAIYQVHKFNSSGIIRLSEGGRLMRCSDQED